MTDAHTRRERLYENYATTHAGRKDRANEALVFRRQIQPRLPRPQAAGQLVVDIGCGQGRLVEQLVAHGYPAARGVDISPEQVGIAHRSGVPGIVCGDFRDLLDRARGTLSAVLATDFLEHFGKDEILEIFDHVHGALEPGGVFIVRSPNATSPFFGNYQFGDFTHETALTPHSFSQISATSGFARAESFSCPPLSTGVKGAVRTAVWGSMAAAIRLVLAVETGKRDHVVTQNFIGVATA